MNDIIKVILLNIILIYFLIKKNKSISMFLIVVLFMYVLYLRGKKLLEGQGFIEEKKDEVKFMKMANLDRLLGKLLNMYEHSEEDCIGGYSDFSPCDKKCGITHKYKTYRVERKAGLFGKSCREEDGRRRKVLCDESDGVYKCMTGESCQEDGDCETNNCDPKTDRCVPKKVCSNTNLDLCNKEECIDLNNHYSYAKREFKYDETESGVKCKLEDKTDSEEEEEEEEEEEVDSGYDPVTVSLEDCDLYYWLEKRTEIGQDQLTSTECVLKIPNSVYLESVDDPKYQERLEKYGLDKLKLPGLYCNIGKQYKSGDSGDDNSIGITKRISETMIKEDFGNYNDLCNTPINSIDHPGDTDGTCEDGYWPPYSYFDDVNNQYINSEQGYSKINISEMCGRCKNGFQKLEDECVSCRGLGSPNNQYINSEIDGEKTLEGVDGNQMGQNVSCTMEGVQSNLNTPAKVSCLSHKSNPVFQCVNNNQIWNSDANDSLVYINDVNDFYNTCCKNCANNHDIITFNDNSDCSINNFNSECNENTSCTSCLQLNLEGSRGTFDYRLDNFTCGSCPEHYHSDGRGECQLEQLPLVLHTCQSLFNSLPTLDTTNPNPICFTEQVQLARDSGCCGDDRDDSPFKSVNYFGSDLCSWCDLVIHNR